MAENVSVAANNARFVEYPYDIRRDSWTALQRERLRVLGALARNGESVLDVGCNSGGFAQFVPGNCVVHGVDLSPALVAEAAKHLASAQVAPAERLPFRAKSVDVVVLGEVLEYVHSPARVLKEAARVARRAVVGSTSHEAGVWGAHRVERHAFMVRSLDEAALVALLAPLGAPEPFVLVRDERGAPQHRVFCVELPR